MPRRHLPLITVDNVSKTYGEHPEDFAQLVLVNVKLTIDDGEFLIIYGPSGSGKSTLMNLLAGLEFPTGGRIFIRGENISKLNNNELAYYHSHRIGMVFQSFNLIKSLNVWENVALPQAATGIPYNLRKKRALHILKLLEMEKFANRHANELSGGQQQRVAIARALINTPGILLVDEPTGNLDSKMGDEVMRLLHDLNYRAKQTVILVTHNPDHLKFGSRVIHFRDGQIEREERPSEKVFGAIPPLLPEEYYDQIVRLKGK